MRQVWLVGTIAELGSTGASVGRSDAQPLQHPNIPGVPRISIRPWSYLLVQRLPSRRSPARTNRVGGMWLMLPRFSTFESGLVDDDESDMSVQTCILRTHIPKATPRSVAMGLRGLSQVLTSPPHTVMSSKIGPRP